MLRIYIEANAFEAPPLMEVAENIPVAQLIPALVKELELPQTDLMGVPLAYGLSHPGKTILPAEQTLYEAGIRTNMYLILAPTIATRPQSPGGQMETRLPTPPIPATPLAPLPVAAQADLMGHFTKDPSFYSGQTLVDQRFFPNDTMDAGWSAASNPTQPAQKKNTTRRAILLLGGATLIAASAGVGYAALNMLHLSGNTVQKISSPTSTQQGMAMAGATPTRPFTPRHATTQLIFNRHQQIVHTVAWSPDGTLLASGASDRQLLIWNEQAQVQTIRKEGNTVHAVSWSPDNTLLAEANGNQVLFLNARNGSLAAPMVQAHTSTVTTLAWSPQQPQKLVSGGNDRRAFVWDTATFQHQTTFTLHTTAVLSASWAADNQTIATSSQGGVVRIWTAQGGQQVHFPYAEAVSINALAFQPKQQMLAVGGADGVLRLWQNGLVCQIQQQNVCQDAAQHFQGHTQAIRAIAWSPDGRFLATAGNDRVLLIWEPAQSQTPLLRIQEQNAILALAWSPDGKKIAAASGGIVTIWALA